MDDKNQNTGLTVDDGGVREAPVLGPLSNGFSNLEAEALSADPNSLSQVAEEAQSAAPPRSIWRRLFRRADLALLALILVGGLILVLTATNHKTPTNKNANVATQYNTQEIPLDGFIASSEGINFGPSNVLINGTLTLNNGAVITPSVQPNSATAGQLYYDQNTNQLAYFNGTVFVPLSASGAVVQSIGGISGQLTLGGGLSVVGNQLTATQAAGVSSFGGRTGAITVGGGLNLVGNTLQNTGVLNVLAGTNTTVTNDGNGNFTVNNVGAGTGTVTSGGGSTGALAMFTGSQNIEDSLVTQSGTTVTITGDLNVVTGGLSLGNALTVSNGGTGTTSLAANGVVVAAGTAPFTSVVAGSPGLCFVSTAGAPTFAACPSSSGVTSLNGLNGALSLANASAAGSTITIDDAGIGTKGIASFNGTNFSASSGAINTIQDINTTAAPTFGRLTLSSSQATNAMLVINNTNGAGSGNLLDLQLNGSSKFSVQPNGNTSVAGTINGQTISSTASFTGSLGVTGATTISGILSANGGTINSSGALNITPGGTLTVGATNQTLALQGSSSSSFAVTNGGNTTTLNFQAPTATVTYRLATAAAGSYDLCSTAGNCAGVGGGVTTAGGTTDRLAKFTSSQGIGDSSISDNGTTVTTTANLVVQGGQTTIGVANSQSGSLTLAYGSANFSGTIVQGALTASRTYTLPDFDGTVCLSSGNCLGGGGGGANTALSNLSSVAINTSLLPGTTSIDLGSGTAPFHELYIAGTSLTPGTNNFKITGASTSGTRTITLPDSSGTVCLNNSTNCGFLTGAGTAFVQNGNTLGAAANLGTNDNFGLNLRTNGTTRLGIDAATGNVNLTGDLAIDGGDLTAAAGLNITPGGTLTAGSTTQVFTLQGSNTSTITATNGANTTTISFQAPTANVNYRFPTAPANTYDICTTVGNCAGSGTGVTTAGGNTGTIPVFTASQAIGDSLLSQSGSTVTANGNFNLASGNFYQINNTQISSANLSNDANLAKLNASQTFTGNTVAFQNGTNSVNAFNIQNAVGSRVLTVDTTGGQVVLGLASTLDGKLVFNNVSNANKVTILPGTPTADRTLTLPDVSGTICTDAGNCAGAGATLQTGYNFSAAGAPRIKVNSTLLGVDIQDADISIAANLFNVRASNGGGLGSVLFGVGNTGQVTFQNSANSTTALNVLTQGGTRVLTVDTTNGQAILGQSTTIDGKLVFNNASNSNQIVLTTAAASGPQTITLPNATGTVCLTIGNCTGAGSSNTLQAAYDAGNTITTTNARDINFALNDTAVDSNFLVNLTCTTSCSSNGRFAVQNAGVDVFHVLPNGGAVLFEPTTDTTTAFNVQTSLGNNMFTVDTANARVGIALGGSNVPTLTGRGVELNGALHLSGSSSVYDNYTTPTGGTVGSRINVANTDLSGNNQVIAVGVTSTSNVTARGISVFDARAVAHQPSIGVFSPDENNIVGFSWNGSNAAANVQTTDHTTGSSTEIIVLQSGNVSGGNGSSGDARVNTGTIAGGTGGTTGSIYVVTGDGLGTNSSSGSVTIDSGAKTGSGTAGSILIGATNASAITIGRSGLTTSNAGALTVAQLLTIPTLGSADTATYLCRNSSNQVAACNTTGTGAAFVQGGNSFGATAVLGTNDGFDVNIKTAGNTVATFNNTNGSALFKNSTNGATGFQIQDSGSAPLLAANTLTRTGGVAGNLIKIGDSTGTDTATTVLQLDATTVDPTTNLAALNGGLFYNSTTNKVSLIENGQVKIICNTTDLGCGTGTVTLQGAYNNSTGGTTPEIILGATRTSLDIQDRSTSNGGSLGVNLLNVRATAANDTTLGTTLFDVDSTGHVGIGAATPTRTLDIATNDSNTTAPAIRLLQGSTGDASVELNNTANSFIV
ncbi:MAG TPA: hypothetical protein VLH86_03005, partial [Patescibacteria group bacterium]|nr:hypothetical protein [Patescibacteria group bacterium]